MTVSAGRYTITELRIRFTLITQTQLNLGDLICFQFMFALSSESIIEESEALSIEKVYLIPRLTLSLRAHYVFYLSLIYFYEFNFLALVYELTI